MKPRSILLIAVVVVAVIVIVAIKPVHSGTAPETVSLRAAAPAAEVAATTHPDIASPATAAAAMALPRLLDLGARRCIPCKLMAPILEDLKTSYAGVMRVDFIDVWEDKAAARAHGISSIPTQIFFAPDGTELYRHEGFLAKDDIIARWRTLGYDLRPAGQPPTRSVPPPAAAAGGAGATNPDPASSADIPAKRNCCGSTP